MMLGSDLLAVSVLGELRVLNYLSDIDGGLESLSRRRVDRVSWLWVV